MNKKHQPLPEFSHDSPSNRTNLLAQEVEDAREIADALNEIRIYHACVSAVSGHASQDLIRAADRWKEAEARYEALLQLAQEV
jgi:hypothetical protein